MITRKEALQNVQKAVETFQRLETNILTLKKALTGPLSNWKLQLVNDENKVVLVTKNPERWCRNVLTHYENLLTNAKEDLANSSTALTERLGLPDDAEPKQEPGDLADDNSGEDEGNDGQQPGSEPSGLGEARQGPDDAPEGPEARPRRYRRPAAPSHT